MNRAGSTLVELMVALLVLAIVAGIVAVGPRSESGPPPVAPVRAAAREARREALATGHAVSRTVGTGADSTIVTAFPDGSIVVDSGAGRAR